MSDVFGNHIVGFPTRPLIFVQVCGHKWADMSEFGRGLAVLNDSKYGYSALNNVIRLSL